jgi:hypothetical protein
MIKRSLFGGTFVLFALALQAQVPDLQWQIALGGSAWDLGWKMDVASNGGYVVAGRTESTDGDVSVNLGGRDAWLVRLDPNGVLLWEKTYGGLNEESFGSVQSTPDGGCIVGGYSMLPSGDVTTNHGYSDMWVVKLDATGAIEWQRSIGGSGQEINTDVKLTSDGGYILAGETHSDDGDITGFHSSSGFAESDAWVVKLDAAGHIEWQNALGGSDADRAWEVQQTSDGGYIVAGDSFSNDGDATGNHGLQDAWLVKLSSTGSLVWHRSYGGSTFDQAFGVIQLTDGQFIMAGNTSSSDGDVSSPGHGLSDLWVVRVDAAGDLVWEKRLGGSDHENAYAMDRSADGGVVIAGVSQSGDGDLSGNHGAMDYWVIKLDTTDSIEWEKNLGGSLMDVTQSIVSTPDGGCAVAGWTYSDDVDVTGFHGGTTDCWVVKLEGQGGAINTIAEPASINFTVFPDPAMNEVIITLNEGPYQGHVTLTDGSGREALRVPTDRAITKLDVSGLSRGSYLMTITTGKASRTKRIVLQ